MGPRADPAADAVFALLALVVVALYCVMVVDGVRIAKRKGRSPHWMWFALHPIGGLIAWICLRAASPVRVCPRCSGRTPLWAAACVKCAQPFGDSLQRFDTHSRATAASPDRITQQILELKRMLDLGLITQQEFDDKKAQALANL